VNDAKPSKSARKRDHLALQSLGEKLIPLDPADLDRLPLDETLRDAVMHAKTIQSHGALRRQRQLIGKLMREADADAIRASLDKLGMQERLARETFREAERWRDRIANEGVLAISEFASRTNGSDGGCDAELEKLLRELVAAKNESAKRRVRRLIFRQIFGRLSALGKPGDP
jgi:ribosome-associated protein